MKRRLILLLSFLICTYTAKAQVITYYKDIQPIFQDKCFSCHTKGKHYFLFDTYSMVRSKSSMLDFVIQNDIMPPWPADDDYQNYKHSRSLTVDEKAIIKRWQETGFLEGEKITYNVKKIKKIKGKHLSIPFHSFSIPANERDTFITFKLPFSFKHSNKINRIEFSSTWLSYIHHINLFIGKSNTKMLDADFVYGYAPGMDQNGFTDGQGFYLPASGEITGDIHIPPISKPINLDLKIFLYTTDIPIEHELFFLGQKGFKIKNMANLIIPHDSVIDVEGEMPVEKDVYITHIMPHMHLLGKRIKVWCVDGMGNQTPLVKIDNWVFQWQNYYEFKEPIFIPGGSTIMVQATYDNTAENKTNPNIPPIDVTEGWLSQQEMLSVFMLAYHPNVK